MSALEGMMVEQFRKNFEYDYWANDKFIKALSEMAQPPEKAVKILAHILFAWDVWLARLMKEDLSGFTNPHPAYSLEECRQKFDQLHGKWGNYLAKLKPEALDERITYPNTQGKRFEQTVQNVLVHVVNHSHYHRGQLAVLVSQAGGARPNTDYNGYTFEIGDAKAL
jgi:uncharacterized damage-inducible protein DinB